MIRVQSLIPLRRTELDAAETTRLPTRPTADGFSTLESTDFTEARADDRNGVSYNLFMSLMFEMMCVWGDYLSEESGIKSGAKCGKFKVQKMADVGGICCFFCDTFLFMII